MITVWRMLLLPFLLQHLVVESHKGVEVDSGGSLARSSSITVGEHHRQLHTMEDKPQNGPTGILQTELQPGSKFGMSSHSAAAIGLLEAQNVSSSTVEGMGNASHHHRSKAMEVESNGDFHRHNTNIGANSSEDAAQTLLRNLHSSSAVLSSGGTHALGQQGHARQNTSSTAPAFVWLFLICCVLFVCASCLWNRERHLKHEKTQDDSDFTSEEEESEERAQLEGFKVTLTKKGLRPGQRLGIGVKEDSQKDCLLVEFVSEGVVSTWNCEHPDLKIQPGDFIFEVNGMRGDARKMKESMRLVDPLVMRVMRPDAQTFTDLIRPKTQRKR